MGTAILKIISYVSVQLHTFKLLLGRFTSFRNPWSRARNHLSGFHLDNPSNIVNRTSHVIRPQPPQHHSQLVCTRSSGHIRIHRYFTTSSNTLETLVAMKMYTSCGLLFFKIPSSVYRGSGRVVDPGVLPGCRWLCQCWV